MRVRWRLAGEWTEACVGGEPFGSYRKLRAEPGYTVRIYWPRKITSVVDQLVDAQAAVLANVAAFEQRALACGFTAPVEEAASGDMWMVKTLDGSFEMRANTYQEAADMVAETHLFGQRLRVISGTRLTT